MSRFLKEPFITPFIVILLLGWFVVTLSIVYHFSEGQAEDRQHIIAINTYVKSLEIGSIIDIERFPLDTYKLVSLYGNKNIYRVQYIGKLFNSDIFYIVQNKTDFILEKIYTFTEDSNLDNLALPLIHADIHAFQ